MHKLERITYIKEVLAMIGISDQPWLSHCANSRVVVGCGLVCFPHAIEINRSEIINQGRSLEQIRIIQQMVGLPVRSEQEPFHRHVRGTQSTCQMLNDKIRIVQADFFFIMICFA